MAKGKPGPVVPSRYEEALGQDDPIEVMLTSPDRLRKLIAGLTEKQLATAPAPGKWSIKQIVSHLADGEVILGARYRMVAAHDRPTILGYDQDAFVEMLGALNAKTSDLADDFEMARWVNMGLLDRLPPGAADRVGLHSERGEESIRTMVQMYAGHDRIHLLQIETIRTGLFPTSVRMKSKPRKASAARSKPAPRVKSSPAKAPARKSPAGKKATKRR
jgi:hypothetical protein